MSLIETSKMIETGARRAGAERVVFWNGQESKKSAPNSEQILEILRSDNPSKFKLQSRVEGQWVDLTKYDDVMCEGSTGRDWSQAIRSGSLGELSAAEQKEIQNWAHSNQKQFHHSLRHLVRNTMPEQNPAGHKIARTALGAVFQLAQSLDDTRLRYAVSQLQITSAFSRLAPDSFENSDFIEFIDAMDPLIPSDESETVWALWRGKFASLSHRQWASDLFKEAVEGDSAGNISDFYFDMGAHTYFSTQKIRSATLSDLDASRIIYGTFRACDQAITWSADETFLRIYGTRLLLLAQQLPEIDFVLTICEDHTGAETLSEELVELSRKITTFNKSGPIQNLVVLSYPAPDWVAQPISFFAAARFFTTRYLLENYPRVYSMDVDLESIDNPIPFLRALPERSVLAPYSRGYHRLSPWRRIMAGNVQFTNAAVSSGVLDQLCTYLNVGLAEPNSWMLDQNALAFVQDNFPGEISDIGKRPFVAPPFKRIWEANYKRANRDRDKLV